jgi:hypothetical protein
MLLTFRAYLRPDGFAPLIGDTDSGQVLPFVRRAPTIMLISWNRRAVLTIRSEDSARVRRRFRTRHLHHARRRSLSLLQREWRGINGRGSHGHNDALSIEVSAGGARSSSIRAHTFTRDLAEATRVSFDCVSFDCADRRLEQNTIASTRRL